MEWVETTGRTIEEAKDAALDQLGVDESEADFEIVEEPKAGLFGRVRREARIRARVRPAPARPRADRRDRRRKGGSGRQKDQDGQSASDTADAPAEVEGADDQPAPVRSSAAAGTSAKGSSSTKAGRGSGRSGGGRGRGSGATREREQDDGGATSDGTHSDRGEAAMSTEVTLAEQRELVADFVDGLIGVFDLDGEVVTADIDDETAEVRVEGDDLGILIGPRGQTLAALQDLARTVAYRQGEVVQGRVRVDVAGYRQRRREALERFTRQVADEVKASGVGKVLEPMSPPDRKVVHDTVNTIDGVETTSEGEEPRRRVVIRPAS